MNKLNSKLVSEKVQNYIMDSIKNKGLYSYYRQIRVNAKMRNGYMPIVDAIEFTIKGCYGSFDFECYEIEKFIDSLELINSDKLDYEDKEKLFYHLMIKHTLKLFKKYKIEKYELMRLNLDENQYIFEDYTRNELIEFDKTIGVKKVLKYRDTKDFRIELCFISKDKVFGYNENSKGEKDYFLRKVKYDSNNKAYFENGTKMYLRSFKRYI